MSSSAALPTRRFLLQLLAFSLLLLLLQPLNGWLSYDRSVLLSQPWRLLTGHWVHVGMLHALINIMVLGLLPWVLPCPEGWRFHAVGVLSALMISIGLYLTAPQVVGYVGLSGVLHAWYVWVALQAWSQPQERLPALVILLGVPLKLWVESSSSSALTSALIGAPVLFEAHQWGALSGLLLFFFFRLKPFDTVETKKSTSHQK